MAEAEVTSGKAELTYVYIYDLYGKLWARQDKKTGKLEYYQFNGHGDVVGLVDDAGQVLNEYTYDIWGGPLTTEETVQNVLRYAGEYWDETVGLQYLRARWYDPGMARFIGEDTYEGELNDPLSLNLYSYVQNNPLKYVDPSGNMAEPYYAQELRHMLKDAKAKGYKINTSNYNLYKNTIRDRYSFNSFLDKNRFNYLYDMAMGRSAYTKSAGNIGWAREQLVKALIKGKEAEYVAALAMGLVPGAVGKTKAPALRYTLKSQDLDWRGAGKSWRDAVDLAFRKTGVDRSEFTATKWAKDANGKSFPVEWRSKNGSEVSIDYSHYGVDRNGNWASGPDAPHVGWQTPGKKNTVGHIILDTVPFGRPPNK
ncbi:polymorphic toxin type 47 domain-containing protein [Paenibacillus sp. MABNR03]|uniref:polymorphic toxin type 47 domain-containing protein n=1 Tax=Paenibacillus sp. MABNR03 TaxID=3142626 RepID=UPI003D297C8B